MMDRPGGMPSSACLFSPQVPYRLELFFQPRSPSTVFFPGLFLTIIPNVSHFSVTHLKRRAKMGTMNGIAMASKLSDLGTKAFGDYGGVFIGDLRLQNELYEVSGKLRQFVNDMGTNGNCTQADIERFEDTLLGTDKTQYQASRAIMDQMAGIVDGDALANNIDEMGKNLMASNGDESLINALCETSDKLKQFVDDFGTNGRITEADLQKFNAMFSGNDGNKYQASEATSNRIKCTDLPSMINSGLACIGASAGAAAACLDPFGGELGCVGWSLGAAATCTNFFNNLGNMCRPVEGNLDPYGGGIDLPGGEPDDPNGMCPADGVGGWGSTDGGGWGNSGGGLSDV
jgi:hypothetical protein